MDDVYQRHTDAELVASARLGLLFPKSAELYTMRTSLVTKKFLDLEPRRCITLSSGMVPARPLYLLRAAPMSVRTLFYRLGSLGYDDMARIMLSRQAVYDVKHPNSV